MPKRRRPRTSVIAPPVYPPLPNWHGLLSPVIAASFAELGISVALWISDDFWHPIHIIQNIGSFEDHRGVAGRRFAYNFRTFEQVKATQRTVRGAHAGFFDLFVPVQHSGQLHGVLVAGPFAVSRPTSGELTKRWYELSGLQGRLSDPWFADYVSATLETLTLEGPLAAAFERLMECFAELVSDQGNASALANEAQTLRQKLAQARQPELMWDAARHVVDDRTAAARPDYARARLRDLGLHELPEQVQVGLLASRGEESDPVDGLLRRAEFQRECVAVAQELGEMVSGKVGDHGVVFLVADHGNPRSVRSKQTALTRRAENIARRLGFTLHTGVGRAPDPLSLPATYRAALWAAEKALIFRRGTVVGQSRPVHSAEQVHELQRELEKSVEERPDLLSSRFDRYVEAVLVHSGHRLEATRAELEIGIERLIQPMLRASVIETKAAEEIRTNMAGAAGSARSVGEIVSAYRQIVSDIEATMRRPVSARQERGTGRAVSYVREHLGEAITLAKGARAAGLAPSHFARLFRRHEGVSFGDYVRTVRLNRAREMLRSSPLTIEQIQKLCGFRSRATFYRAFTLAVGMTPASYRSAKLAG